MSIRRNTGGYITYNPVEPSGNLASSAADGVWSLTQQMQYKEEGNWPDPANIPQYIEDVFSTWLYTGNGGTQTITNGIDLSTKGGLVWIKDRTNANNHALVDTVRGGSSRLSSNLPDAADTNLYLSAFNTTGFSIGTNNATVNQSSDAYVSWTFREQPKFFDIVSYTGNGTNRTIAHNLGSVPGCIMVKRINVGSNWQVYHRSLANTQYLVLNDTAAAATGTTRWNSTTPTSTEFSLGTDSTVNANGGSYIAYLFAHNAGGFGDNLTDNVISCGSFTGTGTTPLDINLGYEPQWILTREANAISNWRITDTMRGDSLTQQLFLFPNLTDAETDLANREYPTATGFNTGTSNRGTNTWIYIAIRRGPMRTPTSGTSVFQPTVYTGQAQPSGATLNTTITPDFYINQRKSGAGQRANLNSRLMGSLAALFSSETSAQDTNGYWLRFEAQNGLIFPPSGSNDNGYSYINLAFRRAPGFFDVVCYTGTGAASQSYNHNLGVAPELMLVKVRSVSGSWAVYSSALSASAVLTLNATDAALTSGSVYSSYWGSGVPTSSVFSVGSIGNTGGNSSTYVAYLFATCPGVSKVGSYTGTGTTKQIDCGFTAGARFVLIKRADSTGDWFIWDTARGIVSGNDPYLLLNSAAAENTSTDYIDTYNAGFEISSTAPAAINANGGTFIFLAIA